MNEEQVIELIESLAKVSENWPSLIELIIDNIKNIL